MKKLFAVLATAITAYIGLALVAGSPASATTPCGIVSQGTHTGLVDVEDGATMTLDLAIGGIEVATPQAKSYVAAMYADSRKLSSITSLSYDTYRFDNSGSDIVVPAYKIETYLDGGTANYTTLVYEPYQNGTVDTDTWQTWHPLDGKWWSSHDMTIGGSMVPKHTLVSWSDITASYKDAVVIDFQASQGTANEGSHTAFRNVSYGSAACPSPSPTHSPTHPAPSPPTHGPTGTTAGSNTHPLLTTPDTGVSPTTGSPSPSPSQEAAALPTDGPSDSLAPLAPTVAATPDFQKTGHAMAWTGGVVLGLLLVVGAIVLLRQGRQRQRQRTQAQHSASSQTATYQQGRVGVDSDPTQTTELPPYQE